MLETALQSPRGIKVETNDQLRLKAALYRAQQANPDYKTKLILATSRTSPNTEVWIVKKGMPEDAS